MAKEFDIDIRLNARGVQRGAAQAKTALAQVRRATLGAHAALAKLTAVFGAGFGLHRLTQQLIGFDNAMRQLQGNAVATTRQIGPLRETILGLGRETRFSSIQVAEAALNLNRAGLSLSETGQSLKATLNLATVGQLSLAEAASISASALNVFGLEAKALGRVTDVIARAASLSDQSVSDMGQAFSFVAPTVARMGGSIEEAATALAVLADNGLRGSRGGTNLARVLSSLESPTGSFEKALGLANVQLETLNPSVVGVTQSLMNLANSQLNLANITDIELKQGLGAVLPAYAQSAERVNQLSGNLQNAEGFSASFAKTLDAGLGGALLQLSSAFSGFTQELDDTLGTQSRVNDITRKIAEGFNLMTRNIDQVVKALELLGIAIGALLLPGFIRSLGSIARLFTGRAGIALGVGGAAAAFRDWGTSLETLQSRIGSVKSEIDGLTGSMKDLTRATAIDTIARSQALLPNLRNDLARAGEIVAERQGGVQAARDRIADRQADLADALRRQEMTIPVGVSEAERQRRLDAVRGGAFGGAVEAAREDRRAAQRDLDAALRTRVDIERQINALETVGRNARAFLEIGNRYGALPLPARRPNAGTPTAPGAPTATDDDFFDRFRREQRLLQAATPPTTPTEPGLPEQPDLESRLPLPNVQDLERVIRLREEMAKLNSQDFLGGARRGLADFNRSFHELNDLGHRFATDTLTSLSDGFGDWVSRMDFSLRSAKDFFRSFAQTAVKQISQILFQTLILRSALSAIGFGAPTAPIPTPNLGLIGPGGTIGGGVHRGGLVGGSGSRPGAVDTIPARLDYGEFVVNRMATSQNLETLNRINQGYAPSEGKVPIYVTNNIEVTQAQGERSEETGKKIAEAVSREMRDLTDARILDSRRPGGSLDRTNQFTI